MSVGGDAQLSCMMQTMRQGYLSSESSSFRSPPERPADHLRRDTFAAWPAAALRDGVTVDHAVDVYAALCNIGVYRELIDERHWTSDQIQAMRWCRGRPPRATRWSAVRSPRSSGCSAPAAAGAARRALARA